MTRNHNFL